MESAIRDRPDLDGVQIYLWETNADGHRIPYALHNNRLEIDLSRSAGPAEEIPPALFLRHDQLDALRRVLIGDAVARDDALADARLVRDRLLTLVERVIGHEF